MNILKLIFLVSIVTSLSFSQIIWLNEAPTRMNWQAAMKYCKDKGAVLPSKKVFKELWLKNNKASDIQGFELSISYWTSDEVKDNKNAAYPFYFMEGRDTWYYKADKYGVKCIKK